jgi:hypothetical protein
MIMVRKTHPTLLVECTTGIWKKGDGLAYQEKLRAEWEHRLHRYL